MLAIVDGVGNGCKNFTERSGFNQDHPTRGLNSIR